MVVLPTPPLPATIRTRLWLQKALTSMTGRSVVSDLPAAAHGPGRPVPAWSAATGRVERSEPVRCPEKSWSDPLFPANGDEYVPLLEEPTGAKGELGTWSKRLTRGS